MPHVYKLTLAVIAGLVGKLHLHRILNNNVCVRVSTWCAEGTVVLLLWAVARLLGDVPVILGHAVAAVPDHRRGAELASC